jgi:RHS repeat-associated protein
LNAGLIDTFREFGRKTPNQTSTTQTKYDFTTGLPLEVTDDFGQTIKTEYNDPLLRPTKTYGIQGLVIPITETIYNDDYDSNTNLASVKVRKQIDETNWDEATTYVDRLGRTVKTQAKDSQGDVIVETKYDNLGRVIATSNPYRNGDTVYWSKPRYDELNRVVETYAPQAGDPLDPNVHGASLGITEWGISTVQDFVGTYTIATDASGRKARSITNALGQLIRIDEPTSTTGNNDQDLGTLLSPNQPTFYQYNPQGKMVHVQQGKVGEAAIQHRYFLYDYLGRLIRVRQPEQEVNTALNKTDLITNNNEWTAGFEYDLVGNLLVTTDAENKKIYNTYDKSGRVKTRSYSDTNTPTVNYYYDGYGLATPPPTTNNYAKGKITKVTSSISTTQFTEFDNFGRNKVSEQITDGNTYQSKYTYDFGGRLVEETYPSGRVVKNEYEADGDLARITSKVNSTAIERLYANGFSYTPDGRIQRLRLGSGVWESAKFNSRLQVSEMTLGNSDGNGNLWKLSYEYGELTNSGTVDTAKNTGNIAKQIVSYQGLAQAYVQSFKYDALDRIIEAKENNDTVNGTQNWQQTYNYDRFGNRTSFSQVVGNTTLAINNQTLPSVDNNTNRFNQNQNYVYDKNGNIVQDIVNNQVRNFVFDADNKQTDVKDANNQTIGKYFYDGEGKRVKKITQSETTVFVYSSGKLVAEYSTATPPENKQTRYFGTDQLVTPRVITNQNGQVISRRDYMPFGEEISINRSPDHKYGVLDDGVRQGFTNYEKDRETNLDFAEARMYNSNHGRFTAVDPLLASGKSANPQTFNRYVYTMNRPTVMSDPSGMQTTSDPDDQPIYMGNTSAFDKFTDAYNYFVNLGGRYLQDFLSSINQARSYATYTSGGEENFEQRLGSSRVSRDNTTFVNPTTVPGLKYVNAQGRKIEPYVNYVPLVGTGKDVAKAIVLSGGRDNKGILIAGGLFVVDFATTFAGGAGPVRKTSTKILEFGSEKAIALGRKEFVYKLADETGSFAYRSWNQEGLATTNVMRNFPQAFEEASKRASRINFALDGILLNDGVEKAVESGGRNWWRHGNMTNRELFEVYTNPILFEKTDFFIQNRPVSPLFRPQ